MSVKDKLSDRQILFCEEYIVDLNATQAAVRAGYSKETARQIGSENLSKLDIQEYISELQEELSKKVKVKQEQVLEELIKIGFSDIKNYYKSGTLELKDLSELDSRLTGAISQIKVTETDSMMGSKKTVEFKLHPKLDALEKIAKHLGFYLEDNKQKTDKPKQVFKIGDTEIEF